MRHRTINKAAATILLCTTASCCYSSVGVTAAQQTSGSGGRGGETEYPYRLFRQSTIQKKARIRKRAEQIQKTQNAPDYGNVDTWGSNSNSWSKGENYYYDEDCNEEHNNYWGSKASKKGKGLKKSKSSKKSKSAKNKKGKGNKSSKCVGPIGTDSPTNAPVPTIVPIVTPMPTRRPRTRRPTPRPVEPIPVPPTFKVSILVSLCVPY